MENRINITLLENFSAVAETGSITHAAEKLFITQSALSKSIARLEREIGCELFERSHSGMIINENGRLLYTHVTKMFDAYDQLIRQLQHRLEIQENSVYMCSSVSSLLTLWSEAISDKEPELHLYVERCSNEEVLHKLTEGKIDFALSTVHYMDERILCRPFVTEELIFLAGEDHPLAQKELVTMQELVREPFTLDNVSAGMKENIERYFAAFGYSLDIAFFSNESLRIQDSSRGISVLTKHMYQALQKAGQQVLKPLALENICMWTIYLVSRRDIEMRPAAKKVYAYVERELQKYSAQLKEV